jgi:hypothetical protein
MKLSFLRHFAEKKGFRLQFLPARGFAESGRAFCKETESDLIFYCWVDAGGLPDVIGHLPVMFFVSHKDDDLPPLGAGPASIYAGAEYYSIVGNSTSAVYGIYALVEIFDAFLSTFS